MERRAADLLQVTLAGELCTELASACEAEVRTQLSVVRRGDVRVLVDLSAVSHYTLEARDTLTGMQILIGRKASQTAYAVGHDVGRSLALWVSHMGGDQVMRSFRTIELSLAWLGGNDTPSTGVRPIARARKTTARERKRIA